MAFGGFSLGDVGAGLTAVGEGIDEYEQQRQRERQINAPMRLKQAEWERTDRERREYNDIANQLRRELHKQEIDIDKVGDLVNALSPSPDHVGLVNVAQSVLEVESRRQKVRGFFRDRTTGGVTTSRPADKDNGRPRDNESEWRTYYPSAIGSPLRAPIRPHLSLSGQSNPPIPTTGTNANSPMQTDTEDVPRAQITVPLPPNSYIEPSQYSQNLQPLTPDEEMEWSVRDPTALAAYNAALERQSQWRERQKKEAALREYNEFIGNSENMSKLAEKDPDTGLPTNNAIWAAATLTALAERAGIGGVTDVMKLYYNQPVAPMRGRGSGGRGSGGGGSRASGTTLGDVLAKWAELTGDPHASVHTFDNGVKITVDDFVASYGYRLPRSAPSVEEQIELAWNDIQKAYAHNSTVTADGAIEAFRNQARQRGIAEEVITGVEAKVRAEWDNWRRAGSLLPDSSATRTASPDSSATRTVPQIRRTNEQITATLDNLQTDDDVKTYLKNLDHGAIEFMKNSRREPTWLSAVVRVGLNTINRDIEAIENRIETLRQDVESIRSRPDDRGIKGLTQQEREMIANKNAMISDLTLKKDSLLGKRDRIKALMPTNQAQGLIGEYSQMRPLEP